MPSTGLKGPYILDRQNIDSNFKQANPGTYVLGRVNSDGTFIVKYVGRSDSDLNDRLHDWVGKYSHFKALYFQSAQDAYQKECVIYHAFGESESLDNKVHPACPEGENWKCPVSNCIYS